jgi:hypothetical protein
MPTERYLGPGVEDLDDPVTEKYRALEESGGLADKFSGTGKNRTRKVDSQQPDVLIEKSTAKNSKPARKEH